MAFAAEPTTPSSTTPPSANAKSQMPPGMVMGPDGKPCKICTAFRNWKPGTTNYTEPDTHREKYKTNNGSADRGGGGQRQKDNASVAAFAGFAAAAAGAGAGASANKDGTSSSKEATQRQPQRTEDQAESDSRPSELPPDCPPDVEALGRATWTFLHATAAYYPEKPNPAQRANMLMLLRSLPVLYPCSWCAQDFGKNIERHPPDVSSREKLSLWLCQRHNEVNEKLGKEIFDCAKVDERWKDGPPDGRCD